MNKSIFLALGVLLVVVGIMGLLGLLVLATGGGSGESDNEGRFTKNKFSCVVELDADYFSDVDIVGAKCTRVGKCYISSQMFIFGWFEEKGEIIFEGSDGVEYASTDYQFGFTEGFETKKYTLRGCAPVTSGNIIVTNEMFGFPDTEYDRQAVNFGGTQ